MRNVDTWDIWLKIAAAVTWAGYGWMMDQPLGQVRLDFQERFLPWERWWHRVAIAAGPDCLTCNHAAYHHEWFCDHPDTRGQQIKDVVIGESSNAPAWCPLRPENRSKPAPPQSPAEAPPG